MAAEIQLNEAEFIVLKSLNREMMLKSEEIKSTYANDAATKEKKMKEIIAGFNSKLTPVLRPYQLQAFSAMSLSANTWAVSDSKIAVTSK